MLALKYYMQSLSNSTSNNIAKILCVLWNIILEMFFFFSNAFSSLPATEINTEPPIWHNSLGPSVFYPVIGSLDWIANHHGKGNILFLLVYFYVERFVILACNASPQTTIHELTECLIHCHTAWLLIKELTPQRMECMRGPMLLEPLGLPVFPIILKQLTWQYGYIAF